MLIARRFLATLVDLAVLGAIVIVGLVAAKGNDWLEPWVALAVAVFLLAQATVVVSKGQSLGKWLARLRLVGASGTPRSAGRVFALRLVLPLLVLAVPFVLQVPVVGLILVLIDGIFAFRDGRTVRDVVSGMRVEAVS